VTTLERKGLCFLIRWAPRWHGLMLHIKESFLLFCQLVREDELMIAHRWCLTTGFVFGVNTV
jgi:hypothetical protein